MISIIVPVYNVAPYLPKCLDSLVNQTYGDIEIICVNDGSTDHSGEILEEYAIKDKRIKIITQENKGLSQARNTGMEHAKGEWMMFVDSDDWIDTDCCEKIIGSTENDYDLYFFSYKREFANNSLTKYIFNKQERIFISESDIRWLYKRLIAPNEEELRNPDKLDSLSTAWGKMYKSAIIKNHNIKFVSTKEIGTEDLLFNVYYFTYLTKAIYLPEPLYHYRKSNATSLTNLYKPHLEKQWYCLFSMIEEWIKDNNKEYLNIPFSHRKSLSIIGMGLNICFSNKKFSDKYADINRILNFSWYKNAISTLPLENFPIHWKLFFFAARQQHALVVLLMLLTIKKIITR